MTATTIRVQMAQRKDTAANWTAANPILLSGEIGYETDTKKFKIGDGTTNWNSLAYLPIPDGSGNLTVTGNLEIGSTGSLTFEGSTADGFETTLAVTDPTDDRTITLPNVSGTVVTTGDIGSVTSTMIADGTIVDADVSATAEIAVSKLANGTANQVIVTDGTNVSWSDDLTLAGNLTVNGTTTTINTQDLLVEDKNIIIGNVDTPSDVTADGGGITLKGATDKTINWVDATDAWTSSERFSVPLGSAASPSLTFTGDSNTGIYSPGADEVAISTNGTGRLSIDANGNVAVDTNTLYVDATNNRVGVGTTPLNKFHVNLGTNENIHFVSVGSGDQRISALNDAVTSNVQLSLQANPLLFRGSGGTEVGRWDTSGRLLVGTSTARSSLGVATKLQVESTTYDGISLIVNNTTAATCPVILIGRSKGAALGSLTLVANNDRLGAFYFQGADGNGTDSSAASIEAFVDGTPGANDMPGRLVFSVTADGASSPTEALRISNNRAITVSDGGNIVLGTGTGTKIGTSTSQKIGFFNETPIVQPTTGIAEAAFVENSGGTAVNVDSTFGGYTIQQVVQALQNLGLLA